MELHEGVRLAVVRAGALDDALEPTAVLWVDHDHDVAAAHGLGDQVGQRHALAGLRGAHQQGSAFEVLQWPMQRVLDGLHSVDVRQADLGVGLGGMPLAEQALQPMRDGELPVVHFREFVQTLRMHRTPFEAEAEEHLGGVFAQAGELPRADDLDATAAQRTAQAQHAHGLAEAVQRHGRAGASDRQRRKQRQRSRSGHAREVAGGDQPGHAGVRLEGGAPGHLVATDKHVIGSRAPCAGRTPQGLRMRPKGRRHAGRGLQRAWT